MKIFISSVRRGLEDERDALPGLIRALGHDPVRFEDFSAQPVASRDACLKGVEGSDAYLLLLGAVYGDPVFDTGLSPTEEECNVARRRGIPILVFLKRNIQMEPRQQEFVQRVEDYTSGRFRTTFDGAVDLQPQVVRAVGELTAQPSPLTWLPLDRPVVVPWVQELNEIRRTMTGRAILECHLVTVEPERLIQARDLEVLPKALTRLGRERDFFASTEAIDAGVDPERAWAVAGQDAGSPRRGIQVRRDGSSSVWGELPGDGLGQIFDPDDIVGRLREAVLIASEVAVSTSERIAPAVRVAPIGLLVEGRIEDLDRRTSAMVGSPREDLAQVDPEESSPWEALTAGAGEIALELAARLLQKLRASRSW